MTSTSDPGRASRTTGIPALACALALAASSGCFKDRGAGTLCVGAECLGGTTTDSTSTSTSTSTGAPTSSTTTADATTGTPVEPPITLRIDSMAFVDPHLFISEEGMPADTDTEGTPASCVNDLTGLANSVLNGDLDDGKFNLLIHFADFGGVPELRLIDGDCEPPAAPGAMRVCRPNEDAVEVILKREVLLDGTCRELEDAVYQPINLPTLNDPVPPCLRTKRASLSLPVSDLVGSLDLRNAQVTATLDDPNKPTKLVNGVVYGFLPMAAAQGLEFDAPLFGVTNLWAVIDVPACLETYPDYLPSTDMFEINDNQVLGAWVALNFTAELVEYLPQG